MVRDTEDIYLVIQQDRLEEAVRDLIRIGLDNIKGWFDPARLEDYNDGNHPLAQIAEVDVSDALGMIERHEAKVLDVRRATEFVEGHLPGAVNIAHTRLASRAGELTKTERLLVNCHSGARSARSVAWLQREGFDVINLKGGMLAWKKALAAVEK